MAKTGVPHSASRRIPRETAPNAWTRRLAERRAAGERTLDLTEMNPARAGLHQPEDEAGLRDALSDPRAGTQPPDPRGLRVAREAVTAYYGDAQLDPDRVVITTGTSESYAHLFRLLADPGDRVLVPAPSYPLFEPIARLEGVEIEPYRLAYDGAWHLEASSLEAAFARSESRARAVVVVQPNLPTGSCLSEQEVRSIEETCARHGAAIVSDEVFIDFPWAGEKDRLPSLFGARAVPTFVLGGLSKACGLPHLKLGWIAACGPSPDTDRLVEGLEWIADLFLSVGSPIQLALPRLLEARGRFQQRVRERVAENFALLRDLSRETPDARVLEAQGGWAAILRMPSRRTGEEWSLALLDRGVAAHPDHFYDLEIPSLVLSAIVAPETLREGLGHLAQLLTTT